MKKLKLLLAAGIVLASWQPIVAQQTWTEDDRQYLLDHLIKSRDSLVAETANLSEKQWQFKESAERWSINEVVEHIALWELLLAREISMSLAAGPQPHLNASAKTDSAVLGFIMETKPHVSVAYTKPFTFTLPMGLNELKNNLAWFLKMRNESIAYLQDAKEDLRSHYLKAGRSNTHQTYITVFGHTYRHLRQIRKIKEHADYPRKKIITKGPMSGGH